MKIIVIKAITAIIVMVIIVIVFIAIITITTVIEISSVRVLYSIIPEFESNLRLEVNMFMQ